MDGLGLPGSILNVVLVNLREWETIKRIPFVHPPEADGQRDVGSKLPVELIDIVGVVDEGLPKQNVQSKLGIILDGVIAKFASSELVTCLA